MHVRFPEAVSIVQPVAELPPARLMSAAAPKLIVVAVVSKRLRVVALVLMVGALRESIPLTPLFGDRTMFPVVAPPRVRVPILRD